MEVLHGVSLRVARGEMAVIIGANGAGKSTTLRAVAGLVAATRGEIRCEGRELVGRAAHRTARDGIALVPEGRLIFPDQSVLDNLRLGAYGRRDGGVVEDIERQLDRFPILRERRRQPAGTLSGGEQQMLAIARSLMARPRLLLLDEPSLGLAPRLVDEVFAALARLRTEGMTLGELWDDLFRGDEIFPILREALAARFPGVRFVDYRVFGSTHGGEEHATIAGLPAKLREHGVDAVVSGMAC